MTDYKTLYEQASALDHDELVQLLVMSQSNSVPKTLYNSMEAHLKGENNLLKKKLAEAEEFKKNAEETCEGYAVTESLMKEIEVEKDNNKKMVDLADRRLQDITELKEQVSLAMDRMDEMEEEMYDEDGIRDNLDMLGLVDEAEHEEKVKELKDEIEQLKMEINDNN